MRPYNILALLRKPEILALIAIAVVYFTRPKEEFLSLLALIIFVTLIAHIAIKWQQRDRNQRWTVTLAQALGIMSDDTGQGSRLLHIVVITGSLVMAYVGQLMIFYDPLEPDTGYVLIVGGAIGFVIALLRLSLPERFLNDTDPINPPETYPTWRVRPLWLFLSILLSIILSGHSQELAATMSLIEYLLLWIPSMVMLVWAFYYPQPASADSTIHKLTRWEYILIVVLFVGALLVRGINLAGEPHPFDGDEANFAEPAATILLNNLRANPFHHGFDAYSMLHPGLISLSMKVFGLNHFAARFPSALIGALTVAALYLLGRELYNWRTGLLSALFMMGWSFHIQFSRLALNQAGDLLFGTLAFYFVVRGLRRHTGVNFAISGVMLALSQMFYLGASSLVVVMVGYVILLLLFQRLLVVRQWRLLLIIPFAAIVTFFPRLHYLRYTEQPLTYHLYPNIILGGQLAEKIKAGEDIPQYLLKQVAGSYLALFSRGDNTNWYGRGSNLLSPVGGPLLLAGVLITLMVARKRPYLILPLLWGATAIFITGTLSISPPTYQRLVTGAPPLALLVGIGASSLAWGLGELAGAAQRRRVVVAVVSATVLLAGLLFYVGVYVRNSNYLKSPAAINSNRVGESMVAASTAGKQVVLVEQFPTGIETTPIVKYMMAGREYISVPNDQPIAETINNSELDIAQPFVLIVPPDRLEEAQLFMYSLPNAADITMKVVDKIDLDEVSHYVFDSPGMADSEEPDS